MKKKQVKCYTYIRVSTLTQADNFSLDAQKEVTELRLEKETTLETVCLLSKR